MDGPFFHRKLRPMKKTLRGDRTAAAGKYVACATRRRRRILRAGFFFTFAGIPCQMKKRQKPDAGETKGKTGVFMVMGERRGQPWKQRCG